VTTTNNFLLLVFAHELAMLRYGQISDYTENLKLPDLLIETT